jgi:hypothetical protein
MNLSRDVLEVLVPTETPLILSRLSDRNSVCQGFRLLPSARDGRRSRRAVVAISCAFRLENVSKDPSIGAVPRNGPFFPLLPPLSEHDTPPGSDANDADGERRRAAIRRWKRNALAERTVDSRSHGGFIGGDGAPAGTAPGLHPTRLSKAHSERGQSRIAGGPLPSLHCCPSKW